MAEAPIASDPTLNPQSIQKLRDVYDEVWTAVAGLEPAGDAANGAEVRDHLAKYIIEIAGRNVDTVSAHDVLARLKSAPPAWAPAAWFRR